MFTNWFRYEISWAVALRNHKKTFAVRICDWVIKFMIHAAVIWKIKSTQSQRKSSKNVKSETRTVFGAKRLIEPITHSWYLDDAWWPIGSWNAMHGMTNQQHESRSGSENSWIEKIRVWLMRVISICRHFLLAANQFSPTRLGALVRWLLIQSPSDPSTPLTILNFLQFHIIQALHQTRTIPWPNSGTFLSAVPLRSSVECKATRTCLCWDDFESFHRHLRARNYRHEMQIRNSFQAIFLYRRQSQLFSNFKWFRRLHCGLGFNKLNWISWKCKLTRWEIPKTDGERRWNLTQKAVNTTKALATLPFLWPTFHSGYVKWTSERNFSSTRNWFFVSFWTLWLSKLLFLLIV